MAKCQDRIACRHVVFPLLFPFLSLSSLEVGRRWWRVGARRRKKERGRGEGGEGKECNDSDSDDGGGSFREITGFTGVRLTGASKGERDARWCWAMKGDEGGDMVAHGCIYAHG